MSIIFTYCMTTKNTEKPLHFYIITLSENVDRQCKRVMGINSHRDV